MRKHTKDYTRSLLNSKIAKLNSLDPTAKLRKEYYFDEIKAAKRYRLTGWDTTWDQLGCKEACVMVDVMILAAQNGKLNLDNVEVKLQTLDTQNTELKRAVKKLLERLETQTETPTDPPKPPSQSDTRIGIGFATILKAYRQRYKEEAELNGRRWIIAVKRAEDAESKLVDLENEIERLKAQLKEAESKTPVSMPLTARELHYALTHDKDTTVQWLWYLFETGLLMEKDMGKVTRILNEAKTEGQLSPANHELAVNMLAQNYHHRIYNPPLG